MLFPYALPRHPGSSERQVNSWLEGREAKGPVWNVQAELFSGPKAHKGVSHPALKIKCYWLQSEAVTFH